MTTLTDRCDEAMARAMAGDNADDIVWWNPNGGGEPPEPYGPRWSTFLPEVAAARAALLSELDAAGWRSVPKAADHNMIHMGKGMIDAGVRPEGVWDVMLAAAPHPFPEDKP